ncbi:hypothetical protein O3M35_003889 [Rhynocoris fuscipes]|uniref:Mucosa-associated lymphoid tissue lymphoma translocation protein 1 n=1 Tax=Rhynocoris fuscipes TaxID=488301 RepID=A0AAW1CGR6_9HEMI
MNLDQCLLEEFRTLHPELYYSVVDLINENENWKSIISALSQFRVKLNLPPHKIRKIESSKSPGEELINELIIRICTVGIFKELLRNCGLTNVLTLISEPELLTIVKQPGEDDSEIYIDFDDDLYLECQAVGLPPPKYQWYFDNVAIENETTSILILKNFSLEKEGSYFCGVSQQIENETYDIFSNTINVFVRDTMPEFIQQPPLEIVTKCGADLNLAVCVSCKSRYTLQWMFGNTILAGETSDTLTLKNVAKKHSGVYRCVAKNSSGEVFTLPSYVIVDVRAGRKRPTAKVALLIANEKYENITHLTTPVNDIILLSEKLTQLKFRVITLMNLTRSEMENTFNWFFQLTPPGSYVFICFVGHGFMASSSRFMMPIDCPGNETFKMENCICDEFLVMKAKNAKLKFIVLMLDMCLKVPKSEENPHISNERAPDFIYGNGDCHVLKLFATASNQSAYEDRKSEYGIYVQHMCKYLTRDQLITHIVIAAHKDFEEKWCSKVQKPFHVQEGGMDIKLTEPAAESEEFISKFESFNKLNNLYELNFSSTGLKSTLYATPHKGKILNAIDLHFSLAFLPLNVQVSPEVIDMSYKIEDSIILTLHNLQKAKNDIYVTIVSKHSEKKDGFDSAVVDLGLPLFAKANIWYPVSDK